jgi:hypothetical protein
MTVNFDDSVVLAILAILPLHETCLWTCNFESNHVKQLVLRRR